MPNIVPLAFLDTSQFTATLVNKYRDQFGKDPRREKTAGSPHHDTQSILLRGPAKPTAQNWFEDIEQVDYPILKEWKSARNLLSRIKNAAAPFLKGQPAVLGKVMIVQLKPHGVVDWHVDEGEYAAAHYRTHLCLIPSPGAFVYSGPEMANLPVGQLTFFENRVLHCATNFGDFARTHLIVDVRRPEDDG